MIHSNNDFLFFARKLLAYQADFIKLLESSFNDNFIYLLNHFLECKGKVIFSSLGKTSYISMKIASTMSSLGTPAIFMHPTEALHGNMGLIQANDLVVLVSHSGETEEVISLAKALKNIGKFIISINGNSSSTLAKIVDFNFSYNSGDEISLNGLAPTTSSTTLLVLGDIISICLEKAKDFTIKDFSSIHPSGAIGRSNLTEVRQIMTPFDSLPISDSNSTLQNALNQINKYRMGILFICDKNKKFIGIITDGDIRRYLINSDFDKNTKIDIIINQRPLFVHNNQSVLDANLLMVSRDRLISILPVINDTKQLVGALSINNILDNGIKLIKKYD